MITPESYKNVCDTCYGRLASFHCCSRIIVSADSTSSRGKLKMRSVFSIKRRASTHLAKKHFTRNNCLLAPLKHGWRTCTILGNLFHSSFAIDPSIQREPGARGSSIDAELVCGTAIGLCPCARFRVEGQT